MKIVQPVILFFMIFPVFMIAGCASNKPIVLNELEQLNGKIISIDRVARTMTIQCAEGVPVTVKMYELADKYETELVDKYVEVQFHRSFSLAPCNSCDELHNEKALSDRTISYVDSISPKEKLLLLRQPDGSTIPLKVKDNFNRLSKVKTGDQVIVHQTESLVILVRENDRLQPASGL